MTTTRPAPALPDASRVETRMRHAPVERGLGMVPAAGPGFVLRAPLHEGVRDADGRVAPVLLALLADSGVGFLVVTAAGLAAGAPTLDLRIDHLGPAAPAATEVRAEYTLLHLDERVAVGRAELGDDTGRPLAHAVATMALTGVPDRPGGLAGEPGSDGEDFRAGRPPFDPARLAPANLHTEGDAGDPDVVFVPGPSATNLNGMSHGAVLAALATAARAGFVARRGQASRPLSETVEFLRPVPIDARLRARTEEVRSGRRFWTVRTELLLPDGRTAVRATGSGMW
ncbi:MAG: thioesterase family protein [Actinomycetota bacterium]|nr:thioesterase family protein [Actinomycetota bacterium]